MLRSLENLGGRLLTFGQEESSASSSSEDDGDDDIEVEAVAQSPGYLGAAALGAAPRGRGGRCLVRRAAVTRNRSLPKGSRTRRTPWRNLYVKSTTRTRRRFSRGARFCTARTPTSGGGTGGVGRGIAQGPRRNEELEERTSLLEQREAQHRLNAENEAKERAEASAALAAQAAAAAAEEAAQAVQPTRIAAINDEVHAAEDELRARATWCDTPTSRPSDSGASSTSSGRRYRDPRFAAAETERMRRDHAGRCPRKEVLEHFHHAAAICSPSARHRASLANVGLRLSGFRPKRPGQRDKSCVSRSLRCRRAIHRSRVSIQQAE